MPILGQKNSNGMEVYNIQGLTFSGMRPDNLGASEYTLVEILVDISGSVNSFKRDLENALKSAVKACNNSPRMNNLLIRMVYFNDQVMEVHGFKELNLINPDTDYNLNCGGMTALNAAIINGVGSMQNYADILYNKHYDTNGIIFIITDGENNITPYDNKYVKEAIDNIISSEKIESLITILIGVNAANYSAKLKYFQNEVGIDSYEDITNFDENVGAKLATFISQSISSQAQSINTGGPSKITNFNI